MEWNNEIDSFFETGSAKCPNCGANIFFNEKFGRLVCNMCGGIYEPESLRPLGRIENRDTEEAGEEEDNKQEFVCDSCGAAVVTDYNTAATFCAFCGSPTLIKRRLSKSFRPDYIIPFKVSKEEAIEKYLKWARTNKGIPKEFLSEAALTKITGYYIPFWLIDADCNALVGGSGQVSEQEVIANFIIDRKIKFQVKRVPFDGCKKISNTLMEAIEPFDYSELKVYNDMYLPGFYAQRYDTSALDMLDLIKIRIDTYAEGLVKHFSTGQYEKVSVGATGSFSENFSQSYALMPVWFLNIKYDGINYGIAVNGQTGEASGNLPISKGRVRTHSALEVLKNVLKYLLITLIPSLIVTIPAVIGVVATGAEEDYRASGGYGPVPFVVLSGLIVWTMFSVFGLKIFIPFIRNKYRNTRFNESVTIDKAPGVEEYIDLKSKIDMENYDRFSHMSTRPENEDRDDPARENLFTLLLSKIFK